jgi:phospholipase C
MKYKLIVLPILAAAACANTSGNTDTTCQTLQQATAAPNAAWPGTVFTIVLENHNASDIMGNSAAPFINQLAKQFAVAGGYHDPFVHPSEPNYLWMVAGENFGILDDNDPSSHSIASTSHIADQLELAGMSWKAYEESMGAPCGLVSQGRYAAKHDPFVYFNDINGWDGKQFQPSQRCTDHVVDYSQLGTDIAANALPRYAFITPNLDDDMHDGSIQQGDQWLATEVPKLMATDAFTKGGVIFILWDEGSGSVSPGDDPPFIAISPLAKGGYVSSAAYDTSSYLQTVRAVLGLADIECGPAPKKAAPMTDLFAVPLAAN